MNEPPPDDPADHAVVFALSWADRLDEYCSLRMEELGIPGRLHGATDFDGDGTWHAFIAQDREGGNITDGISVNSGVFNPRLLQGQAGPVWARARLRDRIDAVIAHEYEEDRTGGHDSAVRSAPQTKLPISDQARRILRSMAP